MIARKNTERKRDPNTAALNISFQKLMESKPKSKWSNFAVTTGKAPKTPILSAFRWQYQHLLIASLIYGHGDKINSLKFISDATGRVTDMVFFQTQMRKYG